MNRVFTSITFVFWGLAIVFFGGGSVAASQDPGIIVQSSARVDGEEIRLGDLAQIKAQDLVRQMLAEISLGRAPRPGKVKTITKRQFLSRLRFHQDVIDGLGIKIPDRVFVKRTSQTVSGKNIQSYLEAYMGREFNDRQIILERLDIPDTDQYPVGEITLSAAGAPRITRDGRFSLGIEIFVDGHKEDRIRTSGRISAFDEVVVALGDLSRGLCLSKTDGVLARHNTFTLDGKGVNDPAALDGMRLTRKVKKGEVILSDWLEPIPLVHKGDVVTLIAQKDSILIRTSGVSQEDGFENSLIEVENIRSGKVVRGLVRKMSTVEVVY